MFKLLLPTCTLFDNSADFKIKLSYQEYKDYIVLSDALLTNRFGESNKARLNMLISPDKISHTISFSIKDKKKIYLTKAKLDLSFLQGDGNKIIVSYLFDSSGKSSLEDVRAQKMTSSDKSRFNRIMELGDDYEEDDNGNQEKDKDRSAESDKTKGQSKNNIQKISITTGLEPYLDAIKGEKKYIINEGGRKYKVTNGRYIGKVDNRFSYLFDLETELHISDDAPISLSIGMEKYPGVIMMCEDFQILVVIGSHLGQSISAAYINVEPWKLLDALADRVNYGIQNNCKMMRKLFEGADLATNKPIEDILKGQNNAKKMALKEPVTIVWGPPGTGKTYTMAEVAIKFLAKNKSVLIVSHSNVSVDGITKQIGKIFRECNELEAIKKGLVLRYGYVRDDELREDKYLNSFAYAASKDKAISKKLESLQKEYEKLKAMSGGISRREVEIHKEIKDIRATIKQREEKCIEKAMVVATTISKAIVDKAFIDRLFDVVIFDEVSMASVLQIMSAASFAKEHMICVGDFMQLSPIVQSDAVKMGEDIFDFLGINNHGKPYYHPWMVMLDEQRRMHPAISKFASINVYKKLLKDHSSVIKNRRDIVKQEMFSNNPVNLIDLSTTYCATTKNADNSRFNILSALLSFSIALKSEGNVDTIGIITPYAAQTRLVRALCLDYKKNHDTSIRCSTVHQFQGSESDVIIFDAVESYPGKKPGWLMSKDFNSIKRLINVAVTRARGKLVVVANRRFWDTNYSSNPNHTFYRLINYLVKEGNTVQHVKDKTLELLVRDLSVIGGPNYYIDNSYLDIFIKDIDSAKGKIVVSLPSGNLDSSVEKKIYDELLKKKKNEIIVLVKCNDYKNLPNNWKKIAWGTNNAVFPLVLIDDKIVWYGTPFADWQFVFKNSALRTPCKIACRVWGKHTADIIKSLSDLEYRETDAGKSPLTERDGGVDIDGDKKGGGLAEYASHLRKCPGCGNYMKMSKGRTGKTILWCKACRKTELLSPEEINSYIYQNGVKCPEHNCDIEARIGQYGLYIKCDCGHTLKPENI